MAIHSPVAEGRCLEYDQIIINGGGKHSLSRPLGGLANGATNFPHRVRVLSDGSYLGN